MLFKVQAYQIKLQNLAVDIRKSFGSNVPILADVGHFLRKVCFRKFSRNKIQCDQIRRNFATLAKHIVTMANF